MPLPRAVPVTLTAAERKTLKKRARGAKTCWRDRLRALIVLAAARGRDNARIAADLGVTADTARKWRGRFATRGLDGLDDLPRSGRPRRISEADRAAVVALACQLPAATGVPLAHWTGPELAAELAAQGLVSAPMSVSSLLRILASHPVKPWQYRSWIYPRDPDFEAKAKVILDIYQGFYEGNGCGRTTGSCRWTPSRPSRPAAAAIPLPRPRPASPCAWSTNTCGTAPSPCSPHSDRPEYANAPRVFVIVDNGSDHRGKTAIGRLRSAHPNAIMIHTPVHASWLNQVEIFFFFFSIQKKVVSPNDFASTDELSQTLLAFIDRYNPTARPFNWKFTASDLTELLHRITEHDKTAASPQADMPLAA